MPAHRYCTLHQVPLTGLLPDGKDTCEARRRLFLFRKNSAGVMLLSKEHPQEIRYRSAEPVLTPESAQERRGTIADVVFPTGIDRRDDLGVPSRFDIYYGMADDRIGVARLDLPDLLPPGVVPGERPHEAAGVSSVRSNRDDLP